MAGPMFDLPEAAGQPMPQRDSDDLRMTISRKQKMREDLRQQLYRAQNEVNRLTTLINMNDMLIEAFISLADRCETMDAQHDEFLRRDEPTAEVRSVTPAKW